MTTYILFLFGAKTLPVLLVRALLRRARWAVQQDIRHGR
jgi:hypothetical protein